MATGETTLDSTDNVQRFDLKWTKTLLYTKKITDYDILNFLYKLQLKVSEKLNRLMAVREARSAKDEHAPGAGMRCRVIAIRDCGLRVLDVESGV